MGKQISCSENKSRHTKAKNMLRGTLYKLSKSNKNQIVSILSVFDQLGLLSKKVVKSCFFLIQVIRNIKSV